MKSFPGNYLKYITKKQLFKIFHFKKNIEQNIIKNLKIKHPEENLPKYIAKQILKKGFIKLPKLDQVYLKEINDEYNYVMDFYKKLDIDYMEEEGILAKFTPIWRVNPKKFGFTFSFFHNNFFLDVAKNFYKQKKIKNFSFNNVIFFHKTKYTNKPLSGKYHYDITPTLKFWLYLNDINNENGPMSVEKYSAKKNQLLMQEKRDDNFVSVIENNCEKLIGEKGSIFIHDTNSSHRANIVFKGYERNIIRAHTLRQDNFFKKFVYK